MIAAEMLINAHTVLIRLQADLGYKPRPQTSHAISTVCAFISISAAIIHVTACIYTGKYVYIIDQARGQDGWILAKFSFCVFMDLDFVSVHKNAKRELGQYPAILTELA